MFCCRRWNGAEELHGLLKAQILDEFGQVDGAAAFGAGRETVEAVIGGVAETDAILLGVADWARTIELLAVLALAVLAEVQPERGGQGGKRKRADLLVGV